MATQLKKPVTSKFERAAQKHRERWQAEFNKEKEDKWRQVMAEIGDLEGLDTHGVMTGHETAKQHIQYTSAYTAGRNTESELDAQQTLHRSHTPQTRARLHHPDSTGSDDAYCKDASELEAAITRQQTENQRLESVVQSEKQAKANLQREKQDLEKAQLQAILDDKREEVEKLKRQVSMLTDMIRQHQGTIEDFQREVEKGRQKELDLGRQLYEAQRAIMALRTSLADEDVRGSTLQQRQQDVYSPSPMELSNSTREMLREQSTRRSSNSGDRTSSSQRTSGIESGSHRSRQRGGYISVPHGKGRRSVIPLVLSSRT